jgi:phosphomannomutase
MAKYYNIEQLMESSGVKFGTSGARGLAVEMTDAVCYAYTTAFLQHLEISQNIRKNCEVAIAGDLRPSSPRICAAVAKAVKDKGYTPIYCGEIPSPAVAYYGLLKKIPSVMVTGSHIPDDRNGIKYNTPLGEIMKEDEQGIRQQNVEIPDTLCDDSDLLKTPFTLPKVNKDATDLYIKRFTDFFGADALKGCKVSIYEHSCVGRDILKTIYSALGAQVTGLGRSDKFISVDTEAIRPEDVVLAANWASTGEYDAILSADGDCDRPLISDEKGNWLRGDVAGILCAQHIGSHVISTPVNCNSAVELCGSFEQVIRTQIGSPFVIAGMKQATSESAHAIVAGYEANGGFMTNSDIQRNGKILKALPTRDAAILHIALLAEAKKRACKISDLVNALPPRYTTSNRLKEFPTELSKAKLALFYSGNFAKDSVFIEENFGDLCGKVESINTTDGIRINFSNGEVIHLRPSGNAPELRCYNEAATEKRAVELNEQCMARMENWRK